jgi:hypothetical protein
MYLRHEKISSRRIGLECSWNSYHLHALASDVNFKQLETPLVVPLNFLLSLPRKVLVVSRAIQAVPFYGTQRAKLS